MIDPASPGSQGGATAPADQGEAAGEDDGNQELGPEAAEVLFNTTIATAATAGSAALTQQLSGLIYGDREAIERQQTSAAATTLAQQQAAKAAQTKNWLMIGGIGVALILVFGVVLKLFK